VYGVEAVGYNTDEPALASIEQMTERYLTEVRRTSPHGPYLLAGWSFGGNVALELARRLEAEGEEVGFLGVLDARAFGDDELESWYRQQSELVRYCIVDGIDGDAVRDLDEAEILEVLLSNAREGDRLPGRAGAGMLRRMISVFTANGAAADAYRAGPPIRAGIHLFKAAEQHPTLTNPVVNPASWQARTSGAVVPHQVPGNHHDLVHPPNAAILAARMDAALPRWADLSDPSSGGDRDEYRPR
jgi:thioesterase domain-containing protein